MNIYTMQIAKAKKAGVDYVDITAEGAQALAESNKDPFCLLGALVAPDWTMVMDLRQGRITIAQYEEKYIAALDSLQQFDTIGIFLHAEFGDNEDVIFACVCPEGQFCHRYTFAKWLAKNIPGVTYCGEYDEEEE